MTASSQEWVARQGRLQSALSAKAVANAMRLEASLKRLDDSLSAEQASLLEQFPDALPGGGQEASSWSFLESPGSDPFEASIATSLPAPLGQKVLAKLTELEKGLKIAEKRRGDQEENICEKLQLSDSMSLELGKSLAAVKAPLSAIEEQVASLALQHSINSKALEGIDAGILKVSSQVSAVQAGLQSSDTDSAASETSKELLTQLKAQVADITASVGFLASAAAALEKTDQIPPITASSLSPEL